MATRKKPAKRIARGNVRHTGLADIRRWWRRKTRRARKRIAKKLHLTTTTKKMHPTPPPKQTTATPGPGLRTLGGKTVNTTPTPRARAAAQPTDNAAPMSERVKRKNGKFNGSTAAKKTANGKKTVAPNPEQRRLLAANKKAAQIDARLTRTEQRIDRMFPDSTDKPEPEAPKKPRKTTTNTTHVTNINNGGVVGLQGTDIVGQNLSVVVNATHPPRTDTTTRPRPRKPRQDTGRATNTDDGVIGIQASHIDQSSAVYVNGRRVPTNKRIEDGDTE